LAALPAFTSGTVSLLDKSDVIDQLVNLRRKIGQAGKEQVLHMRGQHDDLANALCGLIHILTPLQPVAFDFGGAGETWGVLTAPRRGFPGSIGGTAEDAAYRAAMFGIPYRQRGDSSGFIG
jgi:hypothetical protein